MTLHQAGQNETATLVHADLDHPAEAQMQSAVIAVEHIG